MKYKNKDGIELSYDGYNNDSHVNLVKEVISEAIKIGDLEIFSNRAKSEWGWKKVKSFLKENFDV